MRGGPASRNNQRTMRSFTPRQTARLLRKAVPGRLRGTGMAWPSSRPELASLLMALCRSHGTSTLWAKHLSQRSAPLVPTNIPGPFQQYFLAGVCFLPPSSRNSPSHYNPSLGSDIHESARCSIRCFHSYTRLPSRSGTTTSSRL
ncbi:uncharacterized protein CC84DRAFT_275831 [Paraphaeosphaeria sporulosa]|uniref:Uncharacterized protein n=1 Tax=Paraphaeosphaeria sporulosa TaxID=1460663 RepID=A0A177C0M3_9PLEO|nr:uncharacterized protein CC84DRAFT_275831 [Paraphaeosphaeria sporulosa]OAG01035.1 hypothetical protein CC84DRAFT_275831 [Paraphaeosphaeria sporulosa]